MSTDLQYPAPTDSNGNPFVGAVDPASGHLHPLEGGTTTAITGSPTSATAIRLVTETKDGGDAALGATTDAAVTSNATGTVNAHLRGLVAIQADLWDSVNHRLRVDGSGVTQPVSGTVTANAGSNLNTSALALETGGNLATTATNTTGLNNTVGTAASAIPSRLVQIGGSDGTNARAVKTNTSGQLDIRPLTSSDQVTTVPSGTQTVSGTVTANIGTSGSLALDASVTGLQVSQGSTTSGQKGDLVQGAVTTAAPTYTTAQTSPLSLTTAGALRVDNSANTQPVSGTVTANAGTNLNTSALALETGGNLATIATRTPALGQAAMASSSPVVIASDQSNVPGNIKQVNGSTLALGQTTMSASLPVAIASDQGHLTVDQGSSAAAGTRWRTGGDFVEVAGAGTGTVNAQNTDFIPSTDVSAYKWLSLHLTGTFSLTLTFQGSNDNSNFVSVSLMQINGSTNNNTSTSTSSTNQIWAGPIQFRYFRVRATAYTSNTSLAGNLELYTSPTAVWMAQPTISASTSSTPATTDFHLISANTTNATNVKASAGNVYAYELGNNGASDAWVKFHNTAGTPTAGSGVVRTVYVPKGARVTYHNVMGVSFGTGIGISITGGAADADTTAVATSQVTVDIDYK